LPDRQRVARHVHHHVLAFDEEVVVLDGVGVEIGLAALQRELAQEPDFRELVQGVVDGGERDWDASARRLVEQHLGRDVPVALAEQEPAQRDALARRAQAHAAQLVPQVRERAAAQGRARSVGCGPSVGRGPERRCGERRRPGGASRLVGGEGIGTVHRTSRFQQCRKPAGPPQPFRSARGPEGLRRPLMAANRRANRGSPEALPSACDDFMKDAALPMSEVMTRPSSFAYEELLACGRGELFGEATPSFPCRPC
jgi:hypothetical protein